MISQAIIFDGIRNNSHVRENEVGTFVKLLSWQQSSTRRNGADSTSGSTLRSPTMDRVAVTERAGISFVEYGETRGLSIAPKRRAFKLVPVVMEIEGWLLVVGTHCKRDSVNALWRKKAASFKSPDICHMSQNAREKIVIFVLHSRQQTLCGNVLNY